MKKILALAIVSLLATGISVDAKRVKNDFSSVYVPEEGGVKFEKITDDADCVNSTWLVSSKGRLIGYDNSEKLQWWVNPIIALSPDGSRLAYLNWKNKTSNIMVKPATQGGASTQRTFRTSVRDFTWSPDGKEICFTENRGGHSGVYLVNADQGSVVRQITTGIENDFAGQISPDGKHIFFHRGEGNQQYSLWSYDTDKNLFSNYSRGMTPCLVPDDKNVIYCGRFTDTKQCEIWRINVETGREDIILSLPDRSFTTPRLSPDGTWLLVTGTSLDEKEQLLNTDIFVVRTDGTQFTQLTYHPGNDLSAIWAPDGRSIFFVSQRGSATGQYNVWKMDFKL